jgi:hypothetical protein
MKHQRLWVILHGYADQLFSSCQEEVMKLLKILVVVAATGFMGSAQALVTDLGALSPTATVRTDFFTTSGVSFADIFNFTTSAQQNTLFSNAVNFTPSGTDPTLTHVTDLTLTLFGGSNATGSVLGTISSSNGSLIELSRAILAGSYSARVSGLADGKAGGGFQFSVAANPEPAEWMMLLAGLVAVAFMAQRKTIPLMG